MDVTRASTTSSSSSDLSSALSGTKTLGQQDFLNLLVTQLQNQDPLNPQDDTEFISQLAQFSSVEGVKALGVTADRLQAASLLGHTVYATVDSQAVSGTVSAVTYGDEVKLTVGGTTVSLSDVTGITD